MNPDSNSMGDFTDDFTDEDMEAQKGGGLIPKPIFCTLLGTLPLKAASLPCRAKVDMLCAAWGT